MSVSPHDNSHKNTSTSWIKDSYSASIANSCVRFKCKMQQTNFKRKKIHFSQKYFALYDDRDLAFSSSFNGNDCSRISLIGYSPLSELFSMFCWNQNTVSKNYVFFFFLLSSNNFYLLFLCCKFNDLCKVK